jgi:cell division protease FtsH
MSEATTQLVDTEIKRIVDEAYQKAHKIIKNHTEQLHHIAQGLLAFETLSGEEVELLMRGEKIVRADDADAYIGGHRRRSSLPPAAAKKTTHSKSKPVPASGEKS